jgi:poly-gamma-glutamate synthesis protein (capsule biosynthesis protein)
MAFVEIAKPERKQDAPTSQAIPTPTSIPTPRIITVSIWTPPYLAETFGGLLEDPLKALFVSDAAAANVNFEVGEQNLISQWIYALVTPFPSTVQGLSKEELLLNWQGQSTGPYAGQPILMDQNTYEMFTAIWGPPAEARVNVMAENDLVDYAWTHQPAWAIVPFESLDPRWKVLTVDGLSPIHRDFDPNSYPLKVPVSLVGDPDVIALIKSNFSIPSSNRDPQKMTVLAMPGVTALVRATAYVMEKYGITYPGQDIREWLLSADITHISNEVPFAADCPYPNPTQTEIRFCSRDGYIQLLEDVGTDVVELTGDHFQDWGTEAMFHTLDLYRARGWPYY